MRRVCSLLAADGPSYSSCFSFFVSDNHSQVSRASLRIRILDVNDNPPELATPYEAAVCEDAKPGQVASVPQPFSWVSISDCSGLAL